MSNDPDLARAYWLLGRRLARVQWDRTHCSRTLTLDGLGVTHNPACDPWPITVRWSETARDALPDLRGK